jgi:hypothetical protein
MPRDRKKYYRDRYFKRRKLILNHLGGICVICGTDQDLHIDHIDPMTKKFDVSKNATRTWSVLEAELTKCQILCRDHHVQKWRDNHEHTGGANKWKSINHGTLHAYRAYRCRCDLCREAKREEGRRYQKRKLASALPNELQAQTPRVGFEPTHFRLTGGLSSR